MARGVERPAERIEYSQPFVVLITARRKRFKRGPFVDQATWSLVPLPGRETECEGPTRFSRFRRKQPLGSPKPFAVLRA